MVLATSARDGSFWSSSSQEIVLCSAETQGKTDQYISTWLKQQKRDDIVLATKVPYLYTLITSAHLPMLCHAAELRTANHLMLSGSNSMIAQSWINAAKCVCSLKLCRLKCPFTMAGSRVWQQVPQTEWRADADNSKAGGRERQWEPLQTWH